MTNLTITTCRAVQVVEKHDGVAGEALAVGNAVRFDTSNGKLTGSNGSSAGEARCIGLVVEDDLGAVSVLRKGIVDVGDALDALTYDDDVFLSNTDKTLADTAGTVSLIVGTVVPGWAYGPGTADKLLRLDL